MKDYEFTLKYTLPDTATNPDDHIAALFDAGCDDALVGTGQQGRIALDFIRTARSAREAIISALAAVKTAIPDAKLIEVSPDFVGLTDVADIVGCSRQNIRKLMLTHIQTFPAPIHEGSSSVWHLFTVLHWLRERDTYKIDEALLEVSESTMMFNTAKQASAIGKAKLEPLYRLVS